MFQKFSESARRVIFFARYEAGRLGGPTVGTEHLLLGLLWENSWLVEPFLTTGHTVAELRRATEKAARSTGEKMPTSAEMSLDEPAKKVLAYADEESTRLLSSTIDAPHFLLGLLRTRGSKAADLFAQFGLKIDDVRLKIAQGAVSPVQEPFGGVVCAFYGIEIRFDVAAEAVPRVIAEYRGHMAAIEADPVKVVQSDLPARAESMVLEWVALRKDEIIVAWNGGKAGKKTPPIPPLE